MSIASRKTIFVVAGVGNGGGTGAASARAFAKAGYRVALIARNPESLTNIAKDIQAQGGEAAAFPIKAYTHAQVRSGFDEIKKYWPDAEIRVAIWNAAINVHKEFLELTEEEVEESTQTNIIGAFAFARQALLAFQDLELDDKGKRGSLIFTSATAAWRGNKLTSAFASGKTGQRALAQSLNKEFGPKNIHVSNVIVDGMILTDRNANLDGFKHLLEDENKRLSPDSIANVSATYAPKR
ncbi:Carbonyl reductase family member 4 OS=Bos taurus GN=CBR4 PE=2 SV=1 [Rhizoctonia solani AG-1 IB]|uniref:Carbonyl reductase family member 4 n=1 Tax=Thanatephorus cucumeris (strain AG1-IB / isolate 7/3/14) TaxID=1108050 RepID=A0A0B7FL49_THACB|nr:Carbonyl reductase family member 4 OS=Bos taurus GN=CBR4 PE=2 SV=1 [Rhizoctonia solani AG-1 IB]